MNYISIGPCCDTLEILKNNDLKTYSYPFDSIFTSLDIIYDCIEDRFNKFLDRTLYINGVQHSIYNKLLDTEILIKHHINFGYNDNNKPSIHSNFINHHSFESDNDYETYQRRCQRLLNLINDENNKISFIYYNPYTESISDLIEFSNKMQKYKNIYINVIFKNDQPKTILYNNINITIYQNYEFENIFKK